MILTIPGHAITATIKRQPNTNATKTRQQSSTCIQDRPDQSSLFQCNTTTTTTINNTLALSVEVESPSSLSESPGRILEQHSLTLFDINCFIENYLFEILFLDDFDGFFTEFRKTFYCEFEICLV